MNQLTEAQYNALTAKGYTPLQIESEAKRRGFTLPQISSASAPKEGKSVGGFLENAGSSLAKAGTDIVGGLVAAASDIPGTAKALGQTALGGVQKFVPGEQESEKVFDAVVDSMSEKYKDGLFNALYTDPFGVALDASTVAGGAGLGLRAAGAIGKVAKVGEAASTLSKVGRAATVVGDVVDPLYWAMRATGKVAAGTATRFGKLAGAVDEGAIASASRLGIEPKALPAGTFRESALVPGIEAVAARSLTGGKLAEKFTTGSKVIDDAADTLRKNITPVEPTDFASVGKVVADTIQSSEASLRTARNAAYDVALQTKGSASVALDAAPIKTAIKSVESSYSGLKEFKSELKTVVDEIKKLVVSNTDKNGALTLKAAKAIGGRIAEIEKSVGFDSPVMQQLRPVQDAVESAADASLATAFPKRYEALKKAKELHGALKDLGREGITSMAKNAVETGNYERLASLILSSSVSSESLKRLISAMTPEQVGTLRANVFNSIIEGARKTSGGSIRAGSIATQLKGAREAKVAAVIGQYGVDGLRAIERISDSFARASKTYSGSQTAAQASLAADFALASSAVTALFTGNLKTAAASAFMFGGKQALQAFVASDWGQAWIRSGMNLETPVSAIGTGLQEARRAAVVTGGATSEL